MSRLVVSKRLGHLVTLVFLWEAMLNHWLNGNRLLDSEGFNTSSIIGNMDNISNGGRHTSIQGTFSSIPIYFLSLFRLPLKVAKVLDKLLQDFFWECSNENGGAYVVGWSCYR